jgi:two-component system, chemotaxis family, sensor kinase Cph1
MATDSGDPLDFEECAREPIQVPGSIQPHGALLGLAPDLRVVQASANAADWLALDGPIVGRALDELLAPESVRAVALAAARDLEATTLLSLNLADAAGAPSPVDAVVHRSGGLLVLELLRVQAAVRPLTFTDAYRRAQARLVPLHETAGYAQLLAAAADTVQRLTGFDRVMIYRFDADYNGEVVAEVHADGLEPFLGLHYPASDIPPQARALYERNWIRLIADVTYEPVPLDPPANPLTGGPTDLSHSWLRAVSPVHVEYLRNMGVTSSMSVSLLRDGRLWGLIACHHYSGPHEPPYEVCVTAELLGQVLSARLVDAEERDRGQRDAGARGTLTALVAAMGGDQPLANALTEAPVTFDQLIDCDRAVVRVEHRTAAIGERPDEASLRAIAAQLQYRDLLVTDHAAADIPGVAPDIAGVLAVNLGDDQALIWLRGPQPQSVAWAGRPDEKTQVDVGDGTLRLGPRRSFALWQESVADRSLPFTEADRAIAGQLRGHLLSALYARARRLADTALTLQLSLLPSRLPELDGFALAARYIPAAGATVGGDWYDVLELPDGCVALIVGDVSGHGLAAAGTMSQLRSAVRAYALTEAGPAAILDRLRTLTTEVMPIAFASLVIAILDPADGELRIAAAGHPPPIRTRAGVAAPLDLPIGTVLGAPPLDTPGAEATFTLAPGDALLLYTDGLIERRDEPLTTGIERLRTVVEPDLERVVAACRPPESDDDATLLSISRRGA